LQKKALGAESAVLGGESGVPCKQLWGRNR
jgi:hypothetical protein